MTERTRIATPAILWATGALLACLVTAGCPPKGAEGGSPSPTSGAPTSEPTDTDARIATVVTDLEGSLDGYARARRELGERFEAGPLRREGKSIYVTFDRGYGPEEAVWRIRDRDGTVSLEAGNEAARAFAGAIREPTP